ncbi:MAG TPA: Lrp/AsnC ligand binding domain-containing protein [Actinomycetota bacterium]|nr:Lrp/AsnC ligand binding domain-containing protein [Actinomycetota bacterium]
MQTNGDDLHFHVFSHAEDRRPGEVVDAVAENAELGVDFVGQFLGSFQVYAHLRVPPGDTALGDVQQIVDDLWPQGLRTESSFEIQPSRIMGPKRRSPDFCALVRIRPDDDPFSVLERLDDHFEPLFDEDTFWYGAAVVTGRYDLLVDLGRPSLEELGQTIRTHLREIPGIGKTDTALADLRKKSFRRH